MEKAYVLGFKTLQILQNLYLTCECNEYQKSTLDSVKESDPSAIIGW